MRTSPVTDPHSLINGTTGMIWRSVQAFRGHGQACYDRIGCAMIF